MGATIKIPPFPISPDFAAILLFNQYDSRLFMKILYWKLTEICSNPSSALKRVSLYPRVSQSASFFEAKSARNEAVSTDTIGFMGMYILCVGSSTKISTNRNCRVHLTSRSAQLSDSQSSSYTLSPKKGNVHRFRPYNATNYI